jgi:hypothetical protein
MTAIEDRHARFLTSIRPRLDNLAPGPSGPSWLSMLGPTISRKSWTMSISGMERVVSTTCSM